MWLWLLVLMAQQQPELGPEQKQVNELVTRISRLAASEPVVYGIDTRLRTAAALRAKYPKLAREVLHDAQASLSGVSPAAEQARFRIAVIKELTPLDLDEAERLAKSFHHDGGEDYLAQAYDQIFLAIGDHPAQGREIVSRGFAAGAFQMVSASRLLEGYVAKDPAAAVALFSEVLAAFPVETPGSEDVFYLLREARPMVKLSRALTIEAVDKALRAASSESLQINTNERNPDAKATRAKLLGETAVLLELIDPALLEKYQSTRKDLVTPPAPPVTGPPDPAEANKPPAVDIEKLAYADALVAARKMENMDDRAVALITISRREELSAGQRDSVASEVLSLAYKYPMGEDRMVLLAMISRDYARRGELDSSALAAHVLLETYNKVCDCEAATCGTGDKKANCLDDVADFASYLDEFDITPESLDLSNISLDARLLILKLRALLGIKEKGFF